MTAREEQYLLLSLRTNSCKIAKWVLAAMLGGSSIFKCG